MQLPKSIREFIQKQITIEALMVLPERYPTKFNDFIDLQAGYRYVNNPEIDNLTGTNSGDFPPNYYVLCTNYFADPFVFDINEEKQNFPIYFALHGAGRWDFYQVATDIVEFENKLLYIKENYQNIAKIEQEFAQKFDMNLWLWQEVFANIIENLTKEEDKEVIEVELDKNHEIKSVYYQQRYELWQQLKELEAQRNNQTVDLKTYLLTKRQINQRLDEIFEELANL